MIRSAAFLDRCRVTRRNLISAAGLVVPALLASRSAVARERRGDGDNDWDDRDRDDRRHPRCFLKGTLIQTLNGAMPIEDLRVGDALPTHDGGSVVIEEILPYRFIRSRSAAWPHIVRPIRVARGALAPDVPAVDLFLSQNHGLWCEGRLIDAGLLVNGRTIRREMMSAVYELEYFHIRANRNTFILANGTPCETFINAEDYTFDASRFRYQRRRDELAGYLRSAVSPWIDVRCPIDVLRDRLAA